jgi:hypothetical protein
MSKSTLLKDPGINLVVSWTFRGLLTVFVAFFLFMWSTTDQTLFWGKFGIASAESLLEANAKLDSLLVNAHEAKVSLSSLTNGRLIDLYEAHIKKSDKFTVDQKLDIYQDIFERQRIGVDSLRVIIRLRCNQ